MEGFKKITDTKFIGALIPQKKPFVMVDSLLHFEQDKVVAGLTVSNENILAKSDQFTAPGLIEHMAQSVALYTGYQYFLRQEDPPIGYIGAIKKVEIRSLPKLGSKLSTTVDVLHDIMGVTLVFVTTECDGKIIAESEMKTVLAS